MSVSSSTSTNVSNALSGISGYDFSGIVDSLVAAYKLPENQMVTKQTTIQTQKDAWRDVNTRMSALEATLTGLSDSTTWTATQASSSNTNLLSATTGINAVQGVYNIKVINTAQAQSVTSALQNVSSATAATTLAAGSFTITTGGVAKTVTVAAGDSLQTIADSINNAKAGVSATVVQVTGGYQLAITARQTGTANAASFANVTGTVLTDLGILNGSNTLNVSQVAKDALLTINGIQNITSATNTVTSAIPGVTLNINGADNGASTITLNVTADNSTAQTKIKAFVDQYNSTMDFIATKLSYNSTTKVAGDLFGDQTLQGIQERLRGMVSGTLNNPTGPYLTLSSIGISTSAQNYGKDATLSFDTSKFATAMAANPQSVANLFGAAAGGVAPSSDTANTQGLANILENYLHPMVMYGGTFATQQTGYDTQLTELKTQIADFETRATAYQAQQKLKFANLETALSALNSQGASLTSAIASLTSQTSTK
ncbi:flagellar filament capping protein FliD [Desulfosporosinus metallidurans]|uniref:Flagellar hook-associated protein 2 n=1 Tax=Desulfosporosinus metallidurans TaxID=1888891 RepID=A0A1Q8R1Q4_9FIRM|nr:flagellar filament capping protein FliD [Desulfosporosinus metallidurans]OLN33512.1 Flagellar hook-associated protein FliD [Desulfosporosinus metallidurans]